MTLVDSLSSLIRSVDLQHVGMTEVLEIVVKSMHLYPETLHRHSILNKILTAS